VASDRFRSGDLVVLNAGTGVFPAGVTPGETKGMVQPRGRGYGPPPEPDSFPVIWSNGSWTWETSRTVGPTQLDPPADHDSAIYASSRGDR
jgi:hypothetical protein